MEVKGRICLVLSLFVAVCLVSATVSLARSERDRELGVCKLKCEELPGAEQDEKLRCKQSCEKYHQEKQKREREGGQGRERGQSGGRSGEGGGQYDIVFADIERELREMVGKCHQSCQGSKGEQEDPECFRTCMEQYGRPEQGKRRGRGGDDTSMSQKSRKGEREYGKGQQLNNPYVFEDHHFTTRIESEQGSVRVLQKFTDRSELFQGIGKYRVAILEAQPQTFIIPNHWDADTLFFVANGEGTISLINTENSLENHNIKRGDIFRVPAGINAYLINRHNNEKLVLAKILHSISVPGELQTFVGVGGDNPESSFFNAFSNEVLQAAFDMDRGSLEKLFGQQKQQGIFKKATEEQIRALSGKDETRTWPFGERKGPYNIYMEKPSVQNEYGNLHEVDSKDFSDLRDMNVAFSLFNITQGSMAGPFYNTKTTTVLVVADGVGQFEMACPHLSEQAGRNIETSPGYEKVNSQIRRGTVVVIPAGHPVVLEASGEQNLEVIGFGLNSDRNEWFPLAGRDNVMSQWEDEAMELTFGIPANEVQKVIEKQKKKLFFKGPVRRGRAFA
ncbi:hypothetical protein Lser_V15G41724 [Lactuca serriola]